MKEGCWRKGWLFERETVTEREREIKVVIGRDNKAEDERKQHEERERDMTFGHTSVENRGVSSQVVDWRKVQSLSSSLHSPSLAPLPLTATDSTIHRLIYIHATVLALSSQPSCEVQIFILPLHLSLFISLFILQLKISLVFCITLWVSANSWMFFLCMQGVMPKLCVVYQNEFCLQAASLTTVWWVSNLGQSLDGYDLHWPYWQYLEQLSNFL